MAVSRRLQGYSGMRVDWPHLRSIESSTSADFDSTLRGLVTGLTNPYLIRGFDIIIPTASIPASQLVISVSDSAVLCSTATESGTILSVPVGTPNDQLNTANPNVIGAFQSGVPNYIALDYRRVSDTITIDQTSGWSPSEQIEYQRTTPIAQILQYRYIITTNGPGTNLPLYTIYLDNNGNVTDIEKDVTSLFRLGTGGANPNPGNSFNWGNLTNPQPGANPRQEWVNTYFAETTNPVTVQPGDYPQAFFLGDWSIKNLKQWMDAVMSRIKEITTSYYWYFNSAVPGGPGGGGNMGGALNLFDTYFDSIGSVMTGNGTINYNLVLETSIPTFGEYESQFTDPTILPGDSYVEGLTSGNIATLQAFNNSELIINSMTSAAFTFGETLYNRRLFRPLSTLWTLQDYPGVTNRLGWMQRKPNPTGAPININSWSFTNVEDSVDNVGLAYSLIDCVCASAHGFSVGDLVDTSGLVLSPPMTTPNGVVQIAQVVSPTEFIYLWPFLLTGTPSVSTAQAVEDEDIDRLPYMSAYTINSWSYLSTAITLNLGFSNFLAPNTQTGTTTLLSNTITGLTSTASLSLNMAVSGPNIPANSVITGIPSNTSVQISQTPTTPGAANVTFKQQIVVSGLVSTTNAPNGIYTVDGIGAGNNQINITAVSAPTGPATVAANAAVRLEIQSTLMTVEGVSPTQFNVNNAEALVFSDSQITYVVGSNSLPVLGIGSGPIQFDGVIAISTVLNPVLVTTITNDGAGNLTITTTTPHNLVTTPGPLVFEIYGNPANSIYITEYQNVSIQYVSPTIFKLLNTGIISGVSYTNPGNTQQTFVKFQNNPYPGPLQWTSDMIIKAVMGDLSFTIPQTAICATPAQDPNVDPLANKFNYNGQTGTAYIQDGEVAYIKLQRDLSVSNGAVYSTPGGGTINGSTIPLDIYGNPLQSGDFVMFAGENESQWIRIAGVRGTPVGTNSFSLVNDMNQTPSVTQRPAANGPLLYCKGVYSLVYVAKNWQVDVSADSYWIAMRRDNGSAISKMYLRNLELAQGEVRNINDGQDNNLLVYTGANTEAAIFPNYSVSTGGEWIFSQTLVVDSLVPLTQQVTFVTGPALGFQIGDKIVNTVGMTQYIFTVRQVMSQRTVVFNESIAVGISIGNGVQYQQVDFNIEDTDNLTVAERKEDRWASSINTVLNRPIYDESCFVQQINLANTSTIQSGSYIYTGPQNNPTALAWVMHGNVPVTVTIEDAPIVMPGGYSTVGPQAILVSIISGTFNDGDALYQNGSLTGNTITNPGNPPFLSPTLPGGYGPSGIEIVLPPNRRTQVIGSGYVIWPSNSIYRFSNDPVLTGEDLEVYINDTLRQATVDYAETFGGPTAKIQIIRDCPPNTRIRFRLRSSYGSAITQQSASISLQSAYNGGASIVEVTGRPLIMTAGNVNAGGDALEINGSISIYGGNANNGGIFSLGGDQLFVIGDESNKPAQVWTGLEAVKTQSGYTGSGWQRFSAAQTLTNNSGTVITGSAVAIPNFTAMRICITATARRSDGTHGVASFRIEGTFYVESGSVTAAGFPNAQNNGADGDGVNYAIAFAISGNTVVAFAYGANAGTTQWVLGIDYQQVSLSV